MSAGNQGAASLEGSTHMMFGSTSTSACNDSPPLPPPSYTHTHTAGLQGYEPGPFTVISIPAHCSSSSSNVTNADGSGGSSFDPELAVRDPACSNTAVTAIMTCRLAPAPPRINASLIAGIASAGSVLLLLMLLIYLSFKRLGKIKRQLEWWRKHLAGMPKCGEMSIVVTDIEGYSGACLCFCVG